MEGLAVARGERPVGFLQNNIASDTELGYKVSTYGLIVDKPALQERVPGAELADTGLPVCTLSDTRGVSFDCVIVANPARKLREVELFSLRTDKLQAPVLPSASHIVKNQAMQSFTVLKKDIKLATGHGSIS